MIHKVLGHGKEGNPFAYLLKKERVVAAEVVRGDPEFCWATIRCLPFRQKYTSAVLSCAEKLTPERERQIMDDYERVAFGGRAEEFVRVWVRHSEHGRTELHLVVANVHLPTGKRWSHYYDRADRKLFKSWQELTNIRHDLASPDAPERVRLADMPGKLPADKKTLFEKLDAVVCAGVAHGRIQNRADLLKALEAEGYVVKPSRNYVAVKLPGSEEKALRLRGKKYGEDFSREALLASAAKKTAAEEAERQRRFEKDFADAMARRTAFVERVCRPRKRRKKKPPDEVSDEPARDAETVLCRKLTEPPSVATPTEPQPTRTQPEIPNESRLGTNLSTSLRRTDAAGGKTLLAARTAAWGARLAGTCGRLAGLVRRLGAAHADRRRRRRRVGLPALLDQPLCVGGRLLAGVLGRLVRGEAGGVALPGRSVGEPAPSLGGDGREHRERERTPSLPL